jgi:hypothetical protein
MSMRLHSRWGSIVVGVLGAGYALGASVMLVWTIAKLWSFAGLLDYLIWISLVGAAAVGLWFIVVAALSLRIPIRMSLPHFRRHGSGRGQEAAVR